MVAGRTLCEQLLGRTEQTAGKHDDRGRAVAGFDVLRCGEVDQHSVRNVLAAGLASRWRDDTPRGRVKNAEVLEDGRAVVRDEDLA
jgi:hypothetical protein